MVSLGIYRHFKTSDLYEVLAIVIHVETDEELVLYQEFNHKNAVLWVRPISTFLEEVEFNGQSVPRFKFISD